MEAETGESAAHDAQVNRAAYGSLIKSIGLLVNDDIFWVMAGG